MQVNLTTAVQIFFALQLLVVGMSHMIQPGAWVSFFIRVRERGEAGVLQIGLLTLFVGAFIVAFHNIWQGLPIVLTIFGWIQLIKGVVYLAAPQIGLRALQTISQERRGGFVVAGAVLFAFGVALVIHLARLLPLA
ncbi:MAG: hypothetical protein ACF8PN_00820 [Phycisphaerales bacterium]